MPGQYYVYIPYSGVEANAQLLDAANKWRANSADHHQSPEARRKVPKILVHGNGAPLACLSGIAVEDFTLYVMAHCNQGRKTINNINMHIGGRLELTAQVVANRMIADGLPKSTRNIKLFACYGGYDSIGVPDPAAPKPSVLDSFAARLYWSLVSRGVDNVKLSAYTQPLMAATVGEAHSHKRTMAGDRPSLHRRQWPH